MIKLISTLICMIFLIACDHKSDPNWATTEAVISAVEPIDIDGKNRIAYTIKYSAPESTAVDEQGNKILGPIEHHVLETSKTPIENQKIQIRYQKDEPIFFELIDKIKYKDDN